METMEEIYRRNSQMVFRYLVSLTGNPDIAEELTQETFYQAMRSIDSFDGSSKLTTWLCAIAKNTWLAYLRKHPKTKDLDQFVDVFESQENVENIIVERDGYLDLLRIIHGLEEPYREVARLRLLGNLSFREIGDIMARKENWARVTFYRAKLKIQREVEINEK